MIAPATSKPKFPLGCLVATPGVIKALAASRQSPREFLRRHVTGDWGELFADEWQANDEGLACGEPVMSIYETSLGITIFIVTNSDRSCTALLLEEEY